jgi:hypothetical protein
MAYKIVQANCQQVAFNTSTSSVSTSTLKYGDVVLYATSDCYINMGVSSPVAAKAAGNIFVPAGSFLELVTYPGDYVSAIGDSAAGTLMVYPTTN